MIIAVKGMSVMISINKTLTVIINMQMHLFARKAKRNVVLLQRTTLIKIYSKIFTIRKMIVGGGVCGCVCVCVCVCVWRGVI